MGAKYEQAFDEALRWDEQAVGEPLTEQLCDQVLQATNCKSPEEFLTRDNGRHLCSNRLRLLLMSTLSSLNCRWDIGEAGLVQPRLGDVSPGAVRAQPQRA